MYNTECSGGEICTQGAWEPRGRVCTADSQGLLQKGTPHGFKELEVSHSEGRAKQQEERVLEVAGTA